MPIVLVKHVLPSEQDNS